ncbi:MAG: hypothetical protein V1735_00895 [Nanoarchaeota archaeon]
MFCDNDSGEGRAIGRVQYMALPSPADAVLSVDPLFASALVDRESDTGIVRWSMPEVEDYYHRNLLPEIDQSGMTPRQEAVVSAHRDTLQQYGLYFMDFIYSKAGKRFKEFVEAETGKKTDRYYDLDEIVAGNLGEKTVAAVNKWGRGSLLFNTDEIGDYIRDFYRWHPGLFDGDERLLVQHLLMHEFIHRNSPATTLRKSSTQNEVYTERMELEYYLDNLPASGRARQQYLALARDNVVRYTAQMATLFSTSIFEGGSRKEIISRLRNEIRESHGDVLDEAELELLFDSLAEDFRPAADLDEITEKAA